MKRTVFAFVGGSLLLAALVLPLLGQEKAKPADRPGPESPGATGAQAASPRLQVHFVDGSVLKMTLREEKIGLATPYGKLLIPLADVKRIDCATRIPEAALRKIRAAIIDLGSTEFRTREAASAELLKHGARAFRALFEAAHSKDAEVVRRAQALLARIRATVPAEQLLFREHDVIHTTTSTISGRVEGSVLRALTTQFGPVEMKLADVRSIVLPGAANVAAVPRDAQVLWGNTWWKAEVLEIKGGRYRIHYVGYDSSFDEWVGPERIQVNVGVYPTVTTSPPPVVLTPPPPPGGGPPPLPPPVPAGGPQ